ncbi:MAG: isoaspartyl peptidase/L-asparaginase [Saprospiraceae bacterium]|nr:isoaspartyl peptidase/L-asparaginase [Saprospiraceae bacterium]
MPIRLIVHGGAWSIPDEMDAAHLNGVQKALETVYPALQAGISALQAVEQAVNILEEDPTFDAGRGAFLNDQGEIELDAIIMDGRDLSFGAVAAVQNLLHPVSLAQQVMVKTDHSMLVGKGAQAFARAIGMEELDPTVLLTERELAYYHQIKEDPNFKSHHPFEPLPSDTVGAVAMDKDGNLAAATSTGGTPRKMAGRVGDSPIIGAGAYADNQTGAVSTTGWGESIMKVLLAKTVCDRMEHTNAEEAARFGVQVLREKGKGYGGLIGVNAQGDYSFAYNTEKMAWGWVDTRGTIQARIK